MGYDKNIQPKFPAVSTTYPRTRLQIATHLLSYDQEKQILLFLERLAAMPSFLLLADAAPPHRTAPKRKDL
jgi:hypothetical protein